jgi:hypothetical protein
MVIMMIRRVLVEELLHQDSRGWSPVFENFSARSVWARGCIPSCSALNDACDRTTLEMRGLSPMIISGDSR